MDALPPNNNYLFIIIIIIYLFIYLFIYTRVEFGKDCPVLSRCNPFPAIGHRDPEKYIPLAANVSKCKHVLNKAEP